MTKRLEMTSEQYRRYSAAVGRSDLRDAFEDPEAYYLANLAPNPVRVEREPSAEMQFGIDVEAFLRGDDLDYQVIPWEVLSKNGARSTKAWDAFAAEHAGKRLITQKEETALVNALRLVGRAINEHAEARHIIYHEASEWSTRWTWQHTSGLWLKAELDLLIESEDLIVDVKTAKSVKREAFRKSCIEYGYDVQAVQYLESQELRLGRPMSFVFVVIKNSFPFSVECYEADSDFLAYGAYRRNQWIEHYNRALATGRWRSDSHGQVVPVGIPEWARREMLYQGVLAQ